MSGSIFTTPNQYNLYSKYSYVKGSRDSLSTTHGALVVDGGVSVGKSITTGGAVKIQSDAAATSTSTGALVVSGGASIFKDLHLNGRLKVYNTDDIDQVDGKPSFRIGGGMIISKQLSITGQTHLNGGFVSSGAVAMSGELTCTNNVTVHRLYVTSDLPSSSPTTGAVRIVGGVGIDDNLNVSGKIDCDGDCTFHRLALTSALPSSSVITGALTVPGGVGVGEDIYIGKDVRCSGDVYCSELHQGNNDSAFQAFLLGLSIVGDMLQIFGPAGAAAGALINGSCAITGALTKGSGSFLIPHPDPQKEGWQLRHCFVESNTRGDNLYRWRIKSTNGKAIINLPSYFDILNENPMVFINPVRMFGQGYGIFEGNTLEINTNNDGEYDILVIGTRKDKIARDFFDKYECEIPPGCKI